MVCSQLLQLRSVEGTYRDNVWYTTIGPAYIPLALGFARAADPNAKLYINGDDAQQQLLKVSDLSHFFLDYNIESTGEKSDALYKLVTALQKQYTPIDGIGFESHLILNGFPRTFIANFQRFAGLGLELAITELDIRIPLSGTSELLSQQAENYAYVIGITTWDTSDDHS